MRYRVSAQGSITFHISPGTFKPFPFCSSNRVLVKWRVTRVQEIAVAFVRISVFLSVQQFLDFGLKIL